mgnify:FL=1|jgi:hypothetical protein
MAQENNHSLFGFSLDRRKDAAPKKAASFVPKDSQDASTPIVAGGYFGQYVDLDGHVKNDWELIMRYRDMSIHPECDAAIDDIVNETIAGELDDSPVEIELSNLPKVSQSLKTKIREEFHYVLRLLDFDQKAYDIFRRWYIDGRVFYHKVIDLENPKNGIVELRYIDPRKIRKVKEIMKQDTRDMAPQQTENKVGQKTVEYYIYNQKGIRGNDNTGVKIAPDAITYCHSSIVDMNRNMVLSHLHKAIKALNQLRMIEDSLVIYRLSRAPERRIFYIDVGNLPKVKAEQYLKEVMSRYRNKLVYDASTGEIRDDRKYMSMLEDFWLPRREGGRGTEITTLPGGQNLGELEDVKYFQKKLYKALNVPPSRLESDSTFNIGRSAEITRDEVKFQKFVTRLRKNFSQLFHDILKTQLVLKGIITLEDWEDMKGHIQYDYVADNQFSELKQNEMINERLTIASTMDQFIGKFYSVEYIRRQVLKQTEQEMKEIDKQIEAEKEAGIIVDPMEAEMMAAGGMDMAAGQGEVVADDPAASGAPAPQGIDPKDYKKGEF